jgi:hypothetical protein
MGRGPHGLTPVALPIVNVDPALLLTSRQGGRVMYARANAVGPSRVSRAAAAAGGRPDPNGRLE